ncbi:MAG: flagellar M-ring protein FliF, partial [Myxococcota bacterium]
MDKLKEQVLAVWGDMSSNRRWTTVGLLAAVVVGFGLLIASTTQVNWEPLGRGLTQEDLQTAVAALEEKKIPVRMGENDVIEVPAEHLHAARLAVSTKGGSGGVGVGMELFNESNFGQSSFQEKVNYHRALEGELARTIRSLAVIETARVHLVIPKKSLFKKNQKQPSASVKVQVRPGVDLSDGQIRGIRNMVAGAIEGLPAGRVTIIDHRGDMLAGPENGRSMSQDFMDMQQAKESALEAAVVEVLRPVVAGGKVRVQVTADMDFSRRDITEKQLDPDRQVSTSESRSEEASKSQEQKPGGVAGVAGNLPGDADQKAGTMQNKSAKTESIQYDTPSTLTHTQRPAGELKRLTVAVVVGGHMDGDEWKGLTEEETKQLEALAANAVGFDKNRGDTITVLSRKWTEEEVGTAAVAAEPLAPWIRELVKWGFMTLLSTVFAFGVVRPFVKLAKQTPATVKEAIAQAKADGETGLVPAEGQLTDLDLAAASVGGEGLDETVDGESENPAIGQLPEPPLEQERMDEIIDRDNENDPNAQDKNPTFRGERLRLRAVK